MLEFNLLMIFAAFFLQFVPIANLVHFIFKKDFYETLFFSVIVYYFLSPIIVNVLIFFNLFNQIFLLAFFAVLTLFSFFLDKKILNEYAKRKYLLLIPLILFVFNFALNLVPQSFFGILILTVLFSSAVLYIKKLNSYETVFVFVLMFFFGLSVLTTGFSFGDIYHYIFSAQSIVAGRYTFVDSHAGNEYMFHAFLQQAFFALIAKAANVDIITILPLGYFFGLGFITVYFLKKLRDFKLSDAEKWVIYLLFLISLELEFRSRLVGVTMIFYLILEFYDKKKFGFYDKLRFSLLCSCVALTHISLFTILCFYLGILFLISIKYKIKDLTKTIIIAIIVSIIYSSMWWLPLYLRYQFKVNSFWESATIETSTVGLFVKGVGFSNLVFLFVITLFSMLFLREFDLLFMDLMLPVLLLFGFHPLITSFLKKAFIPTSFSAATVPYFIPLGAIALLKSLDKIKIKIEKTEIKKEYIMVFLLVLFLPEFFSFFNYISGKYWELKKELPWNDKLKVFTQEKDNLEAYEWAEKNTDVNSVFLNPDEYVQTEEGLRLYDRNALLIAIVTGRRPYVLNHNYASYFINTFERYQYANFVLYSQNDTERYLMAKSLNLNYIALDKRKDSYFKVFDGLEKAFENNKYLIYKVS